MPLYDVHRRILVRLKHPDIEAGSAIEAASIVEESDEIAQETHRLLQFEARGAIASCDLDEATEPQATSVDLVGDIDHLNTAHFVMDPDTGAMIPEDTTVEFIAEGLSASAMAAARSTIGIVRPRLQEAIEDHPILLAVHAATAQLSIDERDVALSRLDKAIAVLSAARAAVVSHA